MSDTAAPPLKPASRCDATDKRTLAHIEKWMATIREVSHERGDAMTASTRLDRLLASPAKE